MGFLNNQSVLKYQKNCEWDPLERKIIKFLEKISQFRKKLKGGRFGIFQHPFRRKTAKNEGGPFAKKFFRETRLAVPKKIKTGDPLVSPGMVCYAEKQEKLFWFSSLGQMVQFGANLFCRTFKNNFGQFVLMKKESHYNSRVSLHEAPS